MDPEEALIGLQSGGGTDEGPGATVHFLSVLPGGKIPDAHDKAAALILTAMFVGLILIRRNLSKGSTGHVHTSGLDGVIVAVWVFFILAGSKTLAAAFSDKTWAQSLAWIVS